MYGGGENPRGFITRIRKVLETSYSSAQWWGTPVARGACNPMDLTCGGGGGVFISGSLR